MLIHIRDESALTPTFNSDESSPLKVYRVGEFVDTHFAKTFFPDERKRHHALDQQRQGHLPMLSNDDQDTSTKLAVKSPEEPPPLAKL
jgi:hypothetical protein